MDHLSDEECVRVAAAGMIDDDRATRHIASCSDCNRRLNEWGAFIAALRLPTVWEKPALKRSPRPETEPTALFERVSAQKFETLEDEPFSPQLMRAGLDVAHALLRRAPRDSLRLTDTLGSILKRSGLDYPEIAGEIAKDRANALRRLMRYGEAFEALDEAEREYRKLPAPYYELAFVEWGRATLLFALKRYAEASDKAALVRGMFVEFGDDVSAAEVQLLQGGIAFDQGDIQNARVLFVEAAEVLETHDPRPSLALVYQNLCTCDVRLAALDSARESYRRASALLQQFGMAAEVVRLSWSLWEAFAAREDPDAALPYLREAAKGFHDLGMEGDAAEVGLDILEQLVALRRFDEAVPLAREIAALCQRVGVTIDVANAMSYLEQAVKEARATPRFVRDTKVLVAASLRGESRA